MVITEINPIAAFTQPHLNPSFPWRERSTMDLEKPSVYVIHEAAREGRSK